MNLRKQASHDAITILTNSNSGFGWPIAITSPDEITLCVTGFSSDIGQTIDPETGTAVAGRRASIALPIKVLLDAGFAIPRAIADESKKPWVVKFNDAFGRSHTFKVCASMPDIALGIVTCLLEAYTA